MKEFKKYFFETLIQLAILANVFRENSRFTVPEASSIASGPGYSGRVIQTIELDSNGGDLDYLFLNDNISNRYSQYNEGHDLNSTNFNSSDFSMDHGNYVNKQTDTYLNEIQFLRRLNTRSNSNTRTRVGNMNNFLFVAPATFSYTNNNQKELNRLSETRLLFNSIEANINNNQFSKEDLDMDIDIQTIIQQDIDLGIEKSLCYDIDVLSKNNEKGFFAQDKEALKNDFLKETQQQLENQKNLDILTATNFFQSQIPIQEGYKLVLEEDTGELFLMLLQNGNDGSNKTNAENVTLPINESEQKELVNASQSINSTRTKKTEDISEDCIDIKCRCSIFLNDNVVDEIFKIDQVLDSEFHQPGILTPPRSDEDSSSRSSSEEIEQDNLNASSSSSSVETSDDQLESRSPKFLSLVSVNRELSKLDENATQNLNEMVINHPLNLQSNEASRIDELLLLNETWIKNNFSNDLMFNTTENNNNNNNQEPVQVYALDSSQINSQITYINNNQSLQKMNNDESILQTQGEQFDFLYSGQQTFFDEQQTVQAVQSSIEAAQNNSIDNFLLDEEFLNNIEENIQIYENKEENEMTNFESFDFMLNEELIKHEQMSINKSMKTSQLISDTNIENNISIQMPHANLNENAHFNDEAKNNNSMLSSLNNFDIIFLKEEKLEPNNEIPNAPQTSSISSTMHKTNQTAALQGLIHNHTYLHGAESQSDSYHPYSYKNKLKKLLRNMRNQNENQDGNAAARSFESRDEIMLRENNIHLRLAQVVESNAEEFNELLKDNGSLTQEQLNLIKDIRRRGKNKVAAQICRKRKIDSIDSLKEDVEQLNEMKSILQTEYELIHKEIKEMTNKFDILYKDTIGSSVESDDPIIVFINNLKSQLNTANLSAHEKQHLNSEESDSHGYDDSNGDHDDESYLNDEDDDEEGEEDDGDDEGEYGDLENSGKPQVKSDSNKLPIKKLRKY